MKIAILINNDIGLYRFRKELLQKIVADGNQIYVSLPDGNMRDHIEKKCCNDEVQRNKNSLIAKQRKQNIND